MGREKLVHIDLVDCQNLFRKNMLGLLNHMGIGYARATAMHRFSIRYYGNTTRGVIVRGRGIKGKRKTEAPKSNNDMMLSWY